MEKADEDYMSWIPPRENREFYLELTLSFPFLGSPSGY